MLNKKFNLNEFNVLIKRIWLKTKDLSLRGKDLCISIKADLLSKLWNSNISTKIHYAFAGIIILFISALFINVAMINKVNSSKEKLVVSYECLEFFKDMQSEIASEKSVQNLVLSLAKVSDASDQFKQASNQFAQEADAFKTSDSEIRKREIILDSEEKTLLENIEKRQDEYYLMFYDNTKSVSKKMSEIITENISSDSQEYIETDQKRIDLIKEVESLNNDFETDINSMVSSLQKRTNYFYKNIGADFKYMVIYFVLAIIVAISITILFSMMLSKSILTNIRLLSASAKELGEGNLQADVKIEINDEIGSIAGSFNLMSQNLRDMIARVKQAAELVFASTQNMSAITEEIASSSQNQSATSEETLGSMEELDVSIQNISQNVEDITFNIKEVTDLLKNMESAIDNISVSINQVNKQTSNTIKAAENGKAAVSKSKEGMDKIDEAVCNLVGVIKALGKSTSNIGEIVNVIDDIAEQTNLLALNAAIEAARAGSHGAGFTIVAEAIRTLAEKSGQATKEITKLIRGIKEEVGEAVETANEGSVQVSNGVDLAKETERTLALILEEVDKTAIEVKKVTMMTQEQERAIKEIVGSSEQINELAQMMSATVQEQTAASSEVVKAVEYVSQSAGQIADGTGKIAHSTDALSQEAQKLSSVVANFKL